MRTSSRDALPCSSGSSQPEEGSDADGSGAANFGMLRRHLGSDDPVIVQRCPGEPAFGALTSALECAYADAEFPGDSGVVVLLDAGPPHDSRADRGDRS